MDKKSRLSAAVGELKNLRSLIVAALMVAIAVVISSFFIPIGDNTLRIYFTFIPMSMIGAVCGPIIGLIAGFASDMIGFMLHQTGAFFFGYTLSSMIGTMIYGLFLYRKPITVLRLLLMKLTVNVFVNVGLGSLWNSLIYGKAFIYYMTKSIIKNLAMLPVEVLILSVLFAALSPMLARYGYISVENGHGLKILHKR